MHRGRVTKEDSTRTDTGAAGGRITTAKLPRQVPQRLVRRAAPPAETCRTTFAFSQIYFMVKRPSIIRSMTNGGIALSRTLIYDADCGFCTRSAQWLAREGSINIKPWQGFRDLDALGLTEEMVTTAAYWADEGKVTAGAEAAIASALVAKGGGWQAAGHLIMLPGVRRIASSVYKSIARNRHAMPGGTNACKLPR